VLSINCCVWRKRPDKYNHVTNPRIYQYKISLYCLFLLLIDSFPFFIRKDKKREALKKVLIVRLDSIGDFILWLDAAKAFRELFPTSEYQTTLLGNEIWAPLADGLSYFDEVWPLNKQRFFKDIPYRIKTLIKVRRSGFDIVINPAFSREFPFGDSIVRTSGAPTRIGFNGDYFNITKWQKRTSDRWYTKLVAAAGGSFTELERNAEFMRGLGLTGFKSNAPELALISRMPDSFNLKDYYVLCPGAGADFRRWPLSNFVKIAEQIFNATGHTCVICGGPGEEELGKALERQLKVPVTNWAGRTSLRELTSVIAGARLLIGNETGAVHIATAVSTPAICILGGGHFSRFLPYRLETHTDRPLPVAAFNKMDCFNCDWKCKYVLSDNDTLPCIANISVDAVWKEVLGILAKQSS
jgi:ADP-heptose:LPS heptosyltransferase